MLKLKLSALSALSTFIKTISLLIEAHSVRVEKTATDLMIKNSAELSAKFHKNAEACFTEQEKLKF